MKRITTILLANTLKATWIALKMIRHLSAELTEFKHSLVAEIQRLQSEEQVLSASDEAYAA